MRHIYESRHAKPLPTRRFILRLLKHVLFAQLLVALSLFAGMLGYQHFEQMSWIDAFVNAAMILGGMGPMKTDGLSDAGKLFAGLYALYCGLVFIAVMGIMLAPVVHRMMHRFHWEQEKKK